MTRRLHAGGSVFPLVSLVLSHGSGRQAQDRVLTDGGKGARERRVSASRGCVAGRCKERVKGSPIDREHLAAFVAALPRRPLADSDLWLDDHENVVGRFLNCHLSAVYQPVCDLATGEDVGHEAFIRSRGERAESLLEVDAGLSPWNLFATAARDEELVDLDRLCRKVQAVGYFARHPEPRQLFVNVHGRLLVAVREDHGRTYREILARLGIESNRIVVESPEGLAENLLLLTFVLHNYRLNGYRTAVNLARYDQMIPLLEHFRPDYLKIDARNIEGPQVLERVVAIARQYGVEVIIKRAQTAEHRAMLMQGGAALAQGFLFGEPLALGQRNDVAEGMALSNPAREARSYGVRHG